MPRRRGHADQRTQASGRTEGTNRTNARQRTSTRTTNTTVKQTTVPRIITKDVVSSIQFHSKDEIEWGAASEFKQLDTGEAVVMVDGRGVWHCQTPEAKEPLRHAPKFAARKLSLWRDEMLHRPEFVSPQQIQQEREQFLEALTNELRSLAYQSTVGRLDTTGEPISRTPPRLIVDPDSVDNDPHITF